MSKIEVINDKKKLNEKARKFKKHLLQVVQKTELGKFKDLTITRVRLKPDVLPFKGHKDTYKKLAYKLINYAIDKDHFNEYHFSINCDKMCKLGAKMATDLGLVHIPNGNNNT